MENETDEAGRRAPRTLSESDVETARRRPTPRMGRQALERALRRARRRCHVVDPPLPLTEETLPCAAE